MKVLEGTYAFNQEKALLGAFSTLRDCEVFANPHLSFEALILADDFGFKKVILLPVLQFGFGAVIPIPWFEISVCLVLVLSLDQEEFARPRAS